MNVLVIGATGKTGRPVVDALVARGVKVRAGSRTAPPATNPEMNLATGGGATDRAAGDGGTDAGGTDRLATDEGTTHRTVPGGTAAEEAATDRSATDAAAANRAAADGVEPVRFDWADRDTWAPALDGAEGLYVVGPFGQPEPELLLHQLLSAAQAAGVRRVVLLSVLGADRLPAFVPMASWERDVAASGLEWTVLRPNWFHQNFGSGFAPTLRDAGRLELPAGEAELSFVDTRDVAEVAALALTEDGHDGRTYDLTGPEALTHADVLAVIGGAAGTEPRYVALDPADFAAALRARGVPERAAQWQLALFALMREGGNAEVLDTVPRLTGHPARTLAAYAAENASAWRK